MAAITKKDRAFLYSRAMNLSEEAMRTDMLADSTRTEYALTEIADDFRAVAKAQRDLAAKCRQWADNYEEE